MYSPTESWSILIDIFLNSIMHYLANASEIHVQIAYEVYEIIHTSADSEFVNEIRSINK